jgi:aspartate/methionine/tyrosine aminotransferase
MRKPCNENPSKRLISARAAAVAPFLAMDVLAAAKAKERQGGDVIHMEVGQPFAPAPRRALEAARAALANGQIGYTEALGLPSLRERIARHYRDTYGIAVAPERVVVTTGSSAGFALAFLALFEPGARVAITAPGYPAYRNIFGALGIETVSIAVGERDRWAMTGAEIGQLHAATPLKGVLAMSPANPTGTMMTREALAGVAQTAHRHGLWLISDEIYHGLTYEEPAATALAFDDDAIVVNSFSKYYCMTGWRIGWLVVPPALVRPIERLAQNLYISPPFLSQVAAEAAFEAIDDLEAIKSGYAKNRALLLEELPRLGFATAPVDGAFYVYADAGRFTNDSLAFCQRLLDETGVAATPGQDFDAERGQRFLRLCFAGSNEACREAIRRLRGFLR